MVTDPPLSNRALEDQRLFGLIHAVYVEIPQRKVEAIPARALPWRGVSHREFASWKELITGVLSACRHRARAVPVRKRTVAAL